SRRRHTRFKCDWSSDVCSSDLWGALVVLRYSLELARAITASPGICDSLPRTSLVMPSAKYASAESPRFSNGRTATRFGPALSFEIGRASCRERVQSGLVYVALR